MPTEPNAPNSWETQERSPEHRRDTEVERTLEIINGHLHRSRAALDRPEKPARPVLFIMGCARAGSTILFQSLADSGNFAYPTNVISRFYRDPYFGALIHRLLYDLDHNREIFPDEARKLEFKSRLGRSQGAAAPHDFGYFWRNYFTFGSTQGQLTGAPTGEQEKALKSDIAGIEAVFGRPVLMKGMEMNWRIAELRRLFPNSIFLFNHRNILHNAMSILNARRSYVGSEEGWYSYKPDEYERIKHLPAWEQVVAQVWFTERAVRKGLEPIVGTDIIDISYEDMCQKPGMVHERINARLGTSMDYRGPAEFQMNEKAIPKELVDRATLLIDRMASGAFDRSLR